MELKNQNIQIALAADKQRKYEEKRSHFNRLEIIERENRQDSTIPPFNTNKSKF